MASIPVVHVGDGHEAAGLLVAEEAVGRVAVAGAGARAAPDGGVAGWLPGGVAVGAGPAPACGVVRWVDG